MAHNYAIEQYAAGDVLAASIAMNVSDATHRQELRIVCWETSPPRVDVGIPFKWDADVWYHMKLAVELRDGKGIVRGKVWPRGGPEPGKWTIEFVDPIPNPVGAPALYGYGTGILEDSPGAEAFYDNVRVTPSKK